MKRNMRWDCIFQQKEMSEEEDRNVEEEEELYKNNSVVKIMEDMSHVEKSLGVVNKLAVATRSLVMDQNSSWVELMGKMFS